MPDMYDKLGEMLNDALESGKIPQENTFEMESEDSVLERKREYESSDSNLFKDSFDNSNPLNNRNYGNNSRKTDKKKQISTGEVIKLNKYTYNIQFPPQIQNALTTLDIAYPFTHKDITNAYHNKLKKVHPDTQNTIQTSKDVQNIRQYTVDDVRNSYKILRNFFGIK